MIIPYRTRDGDGNDYIKEIKVKEFPTVKRDFICQACGHPAHEGVEVKRAVSGNFTDWAWTGQYICPSCARLLSLYFYNYIVEDGEISVFNVREIYANLIRPHRTPFKFIITTSQKKHLFYRAVENWSDERFAVQMETETIWTDRERMRRLFDFVEGLQTLGVAKGMMLEGELPLDIMMSEYGYDAYEFLRQELQESREIQIPLYCGQRREITQEEAICCITSALTI